MSRRPVISFIVRFEMAKVILLVGLFAFVAVQLSYAAPNPDDATQAAAKATQPPPVKVPAADATPPVPEVPAAPARAEDSETENRKAARFFKPILRTIDVSGLPDLSNTADQSKSLLELPEGLPDLSDLPDLPDDINNETARDQTFFWTKYMPNNRGLESDGDVSDMIEPSTKIADSDSSLNSTETPAPEALSAEAKPDAAEAARAAVKTEAPAEAKA